MPGKQRAPDLHDRAYFAYDGGNLQEAAQLFGELIDRHPRKADYHYMRGLAHKYLRQWPESLRDNLASQALRRKPDEASIWNAGIAATALGDWAQARRQWQLAGITLPPGEGRLDGSFGVASIRLNAWGNGETLYAQRLDPCRARLINIPLPESGYRLGDIVLHDGASTGRRQWGQGLVPVFNAMERLEPSDLPTFAAFVRCDGPADRDALVQARLPGLAHLEDWTESLRHYCLRCSYGSPHNHHEPAKGEAWDPERDIGIAAQARAPVERLLADWKAGGAGRHVDAIEHRDHPASAPEDGQVWWLAPEDQD